MKQIWRSNELYNKISHIPIEDKPTDLLSKFCLIFTSNKEGRESGWLPANTPQLIKKLFYNEFRLKEGVLQSYNDVMLILNPLSILNRIAQSTDEDIFFAMSNIYDDFPLFWVEMLFESYIDLFREIKMNNKYINELLDFDVCIYATNQVANFKNSDHYVKLVLILGREKIEKYLPLLLDSWLQVLGSEKA